MTKYRQSDHAFLAKAPYGERTEVPYAGATSFLRCRYTRELAGVDVAVVGVPLDLATSNRPGTRFGPRGIRQASAQLAWGPQHPWSFDVRDRLAIVDWGDIAFSHGYVDDMMDAVVRDVGAIVEAGVSVLALGGDHFVSLPLLRAQARRHGKLALVHFDAHSDTWRDESYNHGTMFFHAMNEGLIDPAKSVQTGIRTHNPESHGFTILGLADIDRLGPEGVAKTIRRVVGRSKAYLSFDIDCLDPAFAPGTGTPVCGGLSTFQALDILRRLDGIDFVAMDIVEVAPIYDIAEITALAGASLALQYLHLRAKDRPDRTA
ncbi:MAG: agmatinase [Alphaproteobacteria bacterium]